MKKSKKIKSPKKSKINPYLKAGPALQCEYQPPSDIAKIQAQHPQMKQKYEDAAWWLQENTKDALLKDMVLIQETLQQLQTSLDKKDHPTLKEWVKIRNSLKLIQDAAAFDFILDVMPLFGFNKDPDIFPQDIVKMPIRKIKKSA